MDIKIDESINTEIISTSRKTVKRYMIFAKWLFIASFVGILVGLCGTLFHYSIDFATELRTKYPCIMYFMPIAGLIICFLYHLVKQSDQLTTNLVLESIRSSKRIPLVMAPLIFIATTLTHLVGASSGREGAALQLGGSLATFIGEKLKLNENDQRIIIMCGMSAAFSALFRTPIGASIFAIEVVSVGVMYYAALVPCVFAAFIAYIISGNLGVPQTKFFVPCNLEFNIFLLLKIIIVGVACAIVSILFCYVLHTANKLYSKLIKNPYIRVIVGSILVIILTLIVQSHDYLGAGMPIIENALHGNVIWYAFLLKIIFTALSLGAGFKGGEIVPAFFIGSTFGAALGMILGMNPATCAAFGMIAVFCGVTNCPMTSFVLSTEMFGSGAAPYFMLIIAISYMMSGYTGLYTKQKMMYSKYATQFRNELTH